MRSFNKNQAELAIARILAVFAAVAIGITFGHLTGQIAQHYHYALDPRVGYIVGILSAIGTLLTASKVFRAVQQTEDTMKVPTAASAPAYLHNAGLKGGKTVKVEGIAGPSCPTKKVPDPAEKCASCQADLKQEPQADGSVKVTITVNGLSKREFSNLRARIEDSKNVPGTKWEFPKNDGNGIRTITGVVKPGNSQKQALLKLEELTGKRV